MPTSSRSNLVRLKFILILFGRIEKFIGANDNKFLNKRCHVLFLGSSVMEFCKGKFILSDIIVA